MAPLFVFRVWRWVDSTIRWRDSISSQSTRFECWQSTAMDQALLHRPPVSPPTQTVSLSMYHTQRHNIALYCQRICTKYWNSEREITSKTDYRKFARASIRSSYLFIHLFFIQFVFEGIFAWRCYMLYVLVFTFNIHLGLRDEVGTIRAMNMFLSIFDYCLLFSEFCLCSLCSLSRIFFAAWAVLVLLQWAEPLTTNLTELQCVSCHILVLQVEDKKVAKHYRKSWDKCWLENFTDNSAFSVVIVHCCLLQTKTRVKWETNRYIVLFSYKFLWNFL